MLSHPSSFRLTRDLAFGGRCREDWGRFSGPRPAAFKSLRLAELGGPPLTQPSRIGTIENWLERGGMSHETRSDETCFFDSRLADRFGSDASSASLAQSGWFWQNPLPQGNPLMAVSFVDANTGTAVGEYGTILRTTDGGATWTLQ